MLSTGFKLDMNPNTPVTSRSEEQKLQNVDNPDKYTVLYNYRSLNQLKAYYNSIPDKQDYGFLKVYHRCQQACRFPDLLRDGGQSSAL